MSNMNQDETDAINARLYELDQFCDYIVNEIDVAIARENHEKKSLLEMQHKEAMSEIKQLMQQLKSTENQ